MQEQPQAAGTWRIGFDFAAFVLLATVSGMAAAVTLASIALLLSSVVPGTPAETSGSPVTAPNTPASRSAPATFPGALPAIPVKPAASPGVPDALPRVPAAIPAAPGSAPDADDAPDQPPTVLTQVLTQLARVAAPVH